VSRHVSANGTLVRANASYKSFVPLEVALDSEQYKRRLRAQDREDADGPQDPGNRAVDFRGERRRNATHRSVSNPDCSYVSKGGLGDGRLPRLHRQRRHRHRILLGRAHRTRSSTRRRRSRRRPRAERARGATDREPDDSAGPLRALSSVEAFGPLAEGEALRAWTESTGWKGLWWTRGRVDGESLMLGCDGLPTIVEFVRLLESRSGRAPA
jgi:hypothetical protein